jgi:hypothetical protein
MNKGELLISENETEFWRIRKCISPEDDLKPINLAEQRLLFFAARNKGQSYSPKFKYREPRGQEFIGSLEKILKRAESYAAEPAFLPLVRELITWVCKFEHRDSTFGPWLFSLHGKPSEDIVEYADQVLALEHDEIETEEGMDSAGAIDYFQTVLDEYHLTHWKVKLDTMPAKAAVNTQQTTICINDSARFSSLELKRLGVHEIGTHVLRYENGRHQSSEVFRYGFPDYLECEEGLAIKSEERTGLLNNADLRKYGLRVIASELCECNSFSEVFDRVAEHAPSELAFAITTRVKRGLEDTSSEYGYTKDQVYLSGYRRIRDLSVLDIQKLFVGKIGFSELSTLDFTTIDRSNVTIPEWWSI